MRVSPSAPNSFRYLGVLLISCISERIISHPICLDESDPTHRYEASKFKLCHQFQYYGCCDAEKESGIYERYKRLVARGLSEECAEMTKEMLCQECSPLAGHTYLTSYYYRNKTNDLWPGLCKEYCGDFYDKCNPRIGYTYYSKTSFCEELKAVDEYYCYPFVHNPESDDQKYIAPTGCMKICFEEVANNLYQPISAKSSNDGTNRFFVLEQRGYIWIYLANMSKIAHKPFLNITDKIAVDLRNYDVRGVTDFNFHPNFNYNGLIYVYYCYKKSRKLYTRISQFKVSDEDMNEVDVTTEKVVIDIAQDSEKHNGGSILFGTDGFMYFGLGDGGIISERMNRGQDKRELLGKMIRLDIEPLTKNGSAYKIPADNPYVVNPLSGARQEIFATGLRNPWRCSVDKGDPITGDNKGRIFCGDVGSSEYEEVNVIEKGANYGWRVTEGETCSPKSVPGECVEERTRTFTAPIMSYDHTEMDCIIGGFVYRGCQNPELRGLYITASLKRNYLQALREEKNGTWTRVSMCTQKKDICESKGMTSTRPVNILSFSEDLDGELYVLATVTPGPGYKGGKIFKMIHTPDEENRQTTRRECSPSPTSKNITFRGDTILEHYEPIPELQARLMNRTARNPTEGRLEIRFKNGKWGTVCGKVFTERAVHLACRMSANKRFGSIQPKISEYGERKGKIWLMNVNCLGHEKNLLDCYHGGWGNIGNCTHDDDVAIKCGKRLRTAP